MRNGRLRGPAIMFRFPVVFRLPAFCFSIIRFPPGIRAFLAVGLPGTIARDPDGGYRVRTHELRPGWGASYAPRNGGALPAERPLSQRLPLLSD
jgi:hypothetical protein